MRSALVLLPAAVAVLLAGCAASEKSEPTPSPTSETRETSSATPFPAHSSAPRPPDWVPPSDGTWTQSTGIGYGQTMGSDYWDWRVTIQGPPEFGSAAAGEVTVKGAFTVERVRGDHPTVTDDVHFGFIPGIYRDDNDETYGTPRVQCERERLDIGSSTTCRVAFTAPTREIPNFYWLVNNNPFAAWPGQTV